MQLIDTVHHRKAVKQGANHGVLVIQNAHGTTVPFPFQFPENHFCRSAGTYDQSTNQCVFFAEDLLLLHKKHSVGETAGRNQTELQRRAVSMEIAAMHGSAAPMQ